MLDQKISELENMKPQVSAVVLNYNGKEHLQYCIPSLLNTDYDNFEILVVDNASTDDSVQWLKTNHPSVKLIVNKKNMGWSGGNNIGIEHCLSHGSKFIFLANNDIRVDPKWARFAVDIAQNDRRIGLIGFEIFGRGKKGCLGEFRKACANFESIQIEETTNIPGCALFVSSNVFESLGVFDQGFWAYGEENDFQLRAQNAGYHMINVNIPIWHYSEGSFGKKPLFAAMLAMRGEIRLILKHGSVIDAFKKIGSMINIACNPFLNLDLSHAPTRRLRPSTPWINGMLITYAIFWNLIHLSRTLIQRKHDDQLSDRVRHQLDKIL